MTAALTCRSKILRCACPCCPKKIRVSLMTSWVLCGACAKHGIGDRNKLKGRTA